MAYWESVRDPRGLAISGSEAGASYGSPDCPDSSPHCRTTWRPSAGGAPPPGHSPSYPWLFRRLQANVNGTTKKCSRAHMPKCAENMYICTKNV